MKNLFSLGLMSIFLISCATSGELQKAKTCKVWEEQAVVGPFAVDANTKSSRWEGRCTLFGLFVCQWVETDMSGDDIYQDSNGILNRRSKIATYHKDRLVYEKFFLTSMFDIKPVKIDMEKRVATYEVTFPSIVGKGVTGKRKIKFNKACSAKEVAMGTATLITSKNKI
jgi:hypothetical protein